MEPHVTLVGQGRDSRQGVLAHFLIEAREERPESYSEEEGRGDGEKQNGGEAAVRKENDGAKSQGRRARVAKHGEAGSTIQNSTLVHTRVRMATCGRHRNMTRTAPTATEPTVLGMDRWFPTSSLTSPASSTRSLEIPPHQPQGKRGQHCEAHTGDYHGSSHQRGPRVGQPTGPVCSRNDGAGALEGKHGKVLGLAHAPNRVCGRWYSTDCRDDVTKIHTPSVVERSGRR